MTACGSCGKPVSPDVVTCPHCDALVAAWTSAAGSEEPVMYEQPDYARPPSHTSLFPTMQAAPTSASVGIRDVDVASSPDAAIFTAVDKATATRLINTIQAYVHQRETESRRTSTMAGSKPISVSDHDYRISNLSFVIGTFLVVILVLMWSMVATMVFTEMVSAEFIIVTIVLTLAFKPTMKSVRRVFDK